MPGLMERGITVLFFPLEETAFQTTSDTEKLKILVTEVRYFLCLLFFFLLL